MTRTVPLTVCVVVNVTPVIRQDLVRSADTDTPGLSVHHDGNGTMSCVDGAGVRPLGGDGVMQTCRESDSGEQLLVGAAFGEFDAPRCHAGRWSGLTMTSGDDAERLPWISSRPGAADAVGAAVATDAAMSEDTNRILDN